MLAVGRRLPRCLTDEELAKVYEQVNEGTVSGRRNRALLQVMADCGLRVSEVVNVRTDDLQSESGRIRALMVREGKGSKDRIVFCPPQLSDKVLRWLDARRGLGLGRGVVFCRIKGGLGEKLSARALQQMVAGLGEKAGLEKRVTPHVLRHTAATRKLRAKCNLRLVQDALGHASVATTEIYLHIEDSERQQAAQNLPPVDGEEVEVQDEQAAVLEGLLEQVVDFEQQLVELKEKITATLERRRSHAASDRSTSRG